MLKRITTDCTDHTEKPSAVLIHAVKGFTDADVGELHTQIAIPLHGLVCSSRTVMVATKRRRLRNRRRLFSESGSLPLHPPFTPAARHVKTEKLALAPTSQIVRWDFPITLETILDF
jgi:hypothetical protein